MNKQEFLFLEKVFNANIFNTQFHSESKLAKKLIDEGYIVEIIQDKDFPPLGKAVFKYLTLTDAGHIDFCSECDKRYDIDGNLIKKD